MKHKSGTKLFGTHAVQAAWRNPDRVIEALLLTQNALDAFTQFSKANPVQAKRPQPRIVDKREIDNLFPHGTVHQGTVALVEDLPEYNVRDLIIAAPDHAVILILDQVTDPHNVGAIMRSACAFGAAGIIMQRKHAPHLDGVLAKSASGALEHVPVAFETNLSRSIEELKEAGFFVYGLDERGEDIGRMKPGGKVALVLGAEGPGMRRLVKENCDALLKIPMKEGSVESLNVSNAAAVALYALSR